MSEPPVCPHCGGTSEDMLGLDREHWQCPCGEVLTDDDLVALRTFCAERRYDARLEEV